MHKIEKVRNGTYIYRGVRIQRRDDIPNGYWGRWKVYQPHNANPIQRFTKRKEAIAFIDSVK